MKPDPSYEEYYTRWAQVYNTANYDRGLAASMMRRGHAVLEKHFTSHTRFDRVLELGAGTGVHRAFVRHQFDLYVMTDASELVLSQARQANANASGGRLCYSIEDASRLSFSDGSFDRVVATHLLEHIRDPHLALREWTRVVKSGGILSLLQPCDPGLMWRIGRHLGPRASAARAGIAYDYWMAREHVNSIHNLLSLIRYYFDNIVEYWYPAGFDSTDVNLFYACHIKV